MFTIGLTGGIASGKSTAAALLADCGAQVIDVDRMAHETYAVGTTGYAAVVDAFGPGVVGADGTIDRRELGRIVFGDADALRRLTDIIWPQLRERIEKIEEQHRAADGVLVFEAAVLTEAGWQDLFHEVWVVTASLEVRRERLIARNNLSTEQADARIASQPSEAELTRGAAVVIDNSGDLEALTAAVKEAWTALTSRIGG